MFNIEHVQQKGILISYRHSKVSGNDRIITAEKLKCKVTGMGHVILNEHTKFDIMASSKLPEIALFNVNELTRKGDIILQPQNGNVVDECCGVVALMHLPVLYQDVDWRCPIIISCEVQFAKPHHIPATQAARCRELCMV